MHLHKPPELQNVDAKHDAALAKLAEAEKNLATVREAASAAWRKVDEAQNRVRLERESLPVTQAALTEALAEGKPVKDLQQKVSGIRSNIESLDALYMKAKENAGTADRAIGDAQLGTAHAQKEIAQLRFHQLTVKLAEILTPAIPICRELIPLSHQLGTVFEPDSYVLNLQKPRIGRYVLDDSGELRYQL